MSTEAALDETALDETQVVLDPETDEETGAASVPRKPFYSGFCGSGPCRDGQQTNKVGEPIFHCPGEFHNGEKAARPVVYCDCPHHQEPTG